MDGRAWDSRPVLICHEWSAEQRASPAGAWLPFGDRERRRAASVAAVRRAPRESCRASRGCADSTRTAQEASSAHLCSRVRAGHRRASRGRALSNMKATAVVW
eukprot:5646242-Pleurochrysis_carterae.AAC.1